MTAMATRSLAATMVSAALTAFVGGACVGQGGTHAPFTSSRKEP